MKMRDSFWIVAMALIACVLAASLPARADTLPGWKVDEGLRIHLACYGERDSLLTRFNSVPAEPLGLTAPWDADITNINLQAICDLGFPLPRLDGAERYAFYLKFFEYPEGLDPVLSVRRIFGPLLVFRTAAGDALGKFLASPGAVVVKKGCIDRLNKVFSKADPYPALRVPKEPLFVERKQLSPQEFFDGAIPFSSLYVKPAEEYSLDGSDDDLARRSSAGVVAFHREILSLYRDALVPLAAPGPDGMRWFIDQSRCSAAAGSSGVLRIVRVPVAPMVFGNFRELVMPQDPQRVFLTGLLLIYEDEYACRGGVDGMSRSEIFALTESAKKLRSHVFEVGSVIDFRGK